MQVLSLVSFAFLATLHLVNSSPLSKHKSSHHLHCRTETNTSTVLPLHPRLIHQFPFMTWIENLAVRENGEIIMIHLGSNLLYSVDPSVATSTLPAPAKLITTITQRTSLFAIAEHPSHSDLFLISAGNFSMTTGVLEPGSFAIFSINLATSPVIAELVAEIPDALLLNGMASFSSGRSHDKKDILLVPDSYKGIIWVVDLTSNAKTVSIALDLPEMHSPVTKQVGINGIKLHEDYLYFTNSNLATLFRVQFSTKTGTLVEGAVVEKVAGGEGTVFMDDFCIKSTKRSTQVFITTNRGNVVKALEIGKDGQEGELVTVAGTPGGIEVAGPTACAFGRGNVDRETLYVVTTGGLGGGVEGGAKEGGKVVSFEVGELCL